MPTFGIVMRVKPWLVVLRGFDPNQPYSKTQAYPVKASEVSLLKSGMVISAELKWFHQRVRVGDRLGSRSDPLRRAPGRQPV